MALARCLLSVVVGGLLWTAQLDAQVRTGTIRGRVVDSLSQQAVGGATVVVVGTTRGAVARDDGTYTITAVPEGAQRVRASRIGYRPQVQGVTVIVGAAAAVDFTLVQQSAVLEQVVVTGYGTQRREAISSSVATVDADQANVGVVANANQMLQGRVAGVQMTANSGEPGGGAQIRIRGGTSISASNEPLYVVDGVPIQSEGAVARASISGVDAALNRSPLNSINPNDIESITVLKDASATAIYGSYGANGVILIQTKRGAREGSEVEYETYVSAATPAKRLHFLTGDEYRSFVQQQVSAGKLEQSQLAQLGTANTDWEKELMRTGYATNHNLAFSGGSQTTRYRASLNYFDQQGLVRSSGLRRYQGRLNAQHAAFAGRVNLGLNLTAARVFNDFIAMENGGGFTGGVFTNMAIFDPTQPVRVTDPTTGETRYYEIGTGPQGVRNPIGMVEQIQDQAPENRVLGNLTGSIQLIRSLTAATTLGIDYATSVRQTYVPRSSPIGAEFNGVAQQKERSLQSLTFQQLLTFRPDVGGRQEFEAVGGYEYTQTQNRGFEVTMRDFVTDAFEWNNFSAGNLEKSDVPISYEQESKLASFFGRATYGWARRYFLSGVVRYDGSSRLAEGNQWSVFPAVSASWRISEEDFWEGDPLGLSTLALRVAWGRQGNQAVRPYATQLLLRANNNARYPFGTQVVTGLLATQVANPDLKWETSQQSNIGLDYGFANDRFTGLIDFYQKKTTDLLLEVTVPQPAVVERRFENIGSFRAQGIEATLDARLWERPNLTLSSGLVFSAERTKVLELGGDREFLITAAINGQGQSGRYAQRIIVDEPLGTFWGPRFLRVNQDGKQLFACSRSAADCVNGETTSPIGEDEEIIGDANPSFSLGLRSNAIWRQFDASWLWRGEFGKDVFNNTALVYSTKGNSKQGRNFLRSALDDPVAIDEPSIYSSRWIEDGSFVRLQNVTLGYTFSLPARILAGRTARVYVSGDNLLLFTEYDGYDPEVHIDRGLATRGMDYLTYPRARTYTLGARVQF